MAKSLIQADSIVKAFGSHVAVDNLSLDIQQGETLGLLGPNGAGKTTTISMLIGLLKPDSGSISVCGFDPSNRSTKSKIGVSPQSLSLYEELTGQENLQFFGKLYGLDSATLRKRVDEALELSELADRKNDRVSTYSGGMKRRLNIAVALLHRPEVLLLDEPTVGVDPQSRNHILQSIETLSSAGLTVLYTTHYMEEAQRLCDRIAIMDHGKLIAVGSLNDLLDQHAGSSTVEVTVDSQVDATLLHEQWQQIQIDGSKLSFQSDQPLVDVGRLAPMGLNVQSLSVHKPSLESVFLSLTGRSLRDQ